MTCSQLKETLKNPSRPEEGRGNFCQILYAILLSKNPRVNPLKAVCTHANPESIPAATNSHCEVSATI